MASSLALKETITGTDALDINKLYDVNGRVAVGESRTGRPVANSQ